MISDEVGEAGEDRSFHPATHSLARRFLRKRPETCRTESGAVGIPDQVNLSATDEGCVAALIEPRWGVRWAGKLSAQIGSWASHFF